MPMCYDARSFKPTAKQKAVLTAFREADYLCTVKAATDAAKVGRRTWYNWFEKPGFPQWWQTKAEEWFARQLPRISAALLANATRERKSSDPKHDVRAAEILLQRYDKGFGPKSRKGRTDRTDEPAVSDAETRRVLERIAGRLEGSDHANPPRP